MSDVEDIQDLELKRIIGFDGNTRNGLQIHPNGVHIVYPLGMKIAVQNWKTKEQHFLAGHTNAISALAISPNGKYIASGQINHMGFKACIIVWNFETLTQKLMHELHKVRVESICFSCDSLYLTSLGGRDDGNIIVWNVETDEMMCGATASRGTAGYANTVARMHVRSACFISGGDGTLRVWNILKDKNVEGIDVSLGQIRRRIECIVVDEKDIYAYCGSTTGDIVKIGLNYDHDRYITRPIMVPVLVGCYAKMSVRKKSPVAEASEYLDLWSQGVTALLFVSTEIEDHLVVGSGSGMVDMVKERDYIPTSEMVSKTKVPTTPQYTCMKSANVRSRVTSLNRLGDELLAGTAMCEIYTINFNNFDVLLHVTCHNEAIFDVVFPYLYADVFATCGKNDIRVWDTTTGLELLRITVPNFTCSSITFTYDGKAIVSGWNDGEIRAFTPQSGKLMYAILNAHNRGVTALAITRDGTRIVSGGVEGQVRVWSVKPDVQNLLGILKEHKGPVTGIDMSTSDTEAVSSSADGTCIIWNIVRLTRNQIIFANTQFMGVCYHPSGVQLLTCGTDRKIGYWEVLDGSLLRELDGSMSSAINSVHVSRDGNYVVSGGNDLYVKLWKYQAGVATHYGLNHAANITAVKFSPDCKFIISVSADGGIFLWDCPYPLQHDFDDYRSEYCSTHSTCSDRERDWEKPKEGLKPGTAKHEVVETVEKCSSDLLETVRESAETEARGSKMCLEGAKGECPCVVATTCPKRKTSSVTSHTSLISGSKSVPKTKSATTTPLKNSPKAMDLPKGAINSRRNSKQGTPLRCICKCPPGQRAKCQCISTNTK